MPAVRTDLDHIVPFNHQHPSRGGPTTAENLQPLCRHHHRLKHQGGWTVHHSETGTTTWNAPSGRHYASVTAA
ncbi:MAG: HNH endonuclease [Actinocrinis sp.]